MLSQINKSKSCTGCAGFGLISSCSHVLILFIKHRDSQLLAKELAFTLSNLVDKFG